MRIPGVKRKLGEQRETGKIRRGKQGRGRHTSYQKKGPGNKRKERTNLYISSRKKKWGGGSAGDRPVGKTPAGEG